MAQDPWAEFRAGPAQAPQQAPPAQNPYHIPPNPILAQRAAEEDQRKRQDQIIQQQAAADAAADAQRKAEKDRRDHLTWEATHNPDGSKKPEATTQTADAILERRNRIREAQANLKNLRDIVSSSNMGTGSIVGQESFRAGDDFLGASKFFNQTANNVAGGIEMVQGDLINQVRMEMQDSGAPIGVKGADTEKEASRLAASIANLAQTQDEAEFLTGLQRAEDYYKRRDEAARSQLSGLGIAVDDDEPDSFTDDQKLKIRDFARRANTPQELTDFAKELSGGRLSLGNADEVLAYWREHGAIGDVADPVPPDGGAPPPAGPGGGFMGQLGTATQSTLAGLAKGYAANVYDLPMEAVGGIQRGINYAVGEGGGALMDMVGADDAADWWRQGSRGVESDIANRPSLSGLIEQASPTPPGMGASRLTAELLGGMAVPFGPKAVPRVAVPTAAARPSPNAAREVIDAGRQNNVRVMTSDVRPPTTFTGKAARAFGERIPYAGTGGPRAAQQAERTEAVRNLARKYGVEADAAIIDDVAADLAKTRGHKLAGFSRQKNTVIDSVQAPLAPANVTRTLEAIDAQVQRLSGIDATEYAPVIDRLTRFGANIASGKSLRQVEENRKLLGAMFEDASLASLKSEGQKAINAIYAPLRDDMADFIGSTAGKAAQGQWRRANNELAAMAGELSDNVFRGVLRDAETTPENVAKLLFSTKPSEVGRLVANLSPAGRAKAQAAVIARAIDQSGGLENISPDRFANAVGKLGKSVGVVFEGADLARIKGLERLLQATKQAGVASAAPPTGVQNAPLLMAGGVGATGGTAAVPLAALGGLARLYESAAVRNMLVGLGKAPKGSRSESRLLERILKVATSQTQIRGSAANDALSLSPSRAVAGEQEND